MARRIKRKGGSRRGFSMRRFSRKAARSTRQGKLIQLDAMAYGALRAKTSSMLVPYTQNILGGFGTLADEATMGVVSWAAAKYGSGFVKNIGEKGLTIENARVGEALATEGLNLGGNNTSSNGGW